MQASVPTLPGNQLGKPYRLELLRSGKIDGGIAGELSGEKMEGT